MHSAGVLALSVMLLLGAPAAALDGLRDVHVQRVGADEPNAFCAGFLLSNGQAARALQQSVQITREQYLQRFQFLPCYVQGTAQLGADPVAWEIRAGGNGTIMTADGKVVHLGCAECERTFGAP